MVASGICIQKALRLEQQDVGPQDESRAAKDHPSRRLYSRFRQTARSAIRDMLAGKLCLGFVKDVRSNNINNSNLVPLRSDWRAVGVPRTSLQFPCKRANRAKGIRGWRSWIKMIPIVTMASSIAIRV